MKILLLEDDSVVSEFVCETLARNHFEVTACTNLPTARNQMAQCGFACAILDRHLPDGDSLALVKQMHTDQVQLPPILFLTALDTLEDKIDGLGIADDYLVKPFAIDELMARVGALIRRNGNNMPSMEAAGIELDRLARTVRRNGKPVELNAMEFKLLEYLITHKNQVVSRKMLLQDVWRYDFEPSTSIVETYISRLRSKLNVEAGTESITTVRGVGYSIFDDQ